MTVFLIQQQADIHHRFCSAFVTKCVFFFFFCMCVYLSRSRSRLSHCSFFPGYTSNILKLCTFTMEAAQSWCNNSLLLLCALFLVESHLHSRGRQRVFSRILPPAHIFKANPGDHITSRRPVSVCVCVCVCVCVR